VKGVDVPALRTHVRVRNRAAAAAAAAAAGCCDPPAAVYLDATANDIVVRSSMTVGSWAEIATVGGTDPVLLKATSANTIRCLPYNAWE
jgi:hypothetical protein